jgi:hypothetical protein
MAKQQTGATAQNGHEEEIAQYEKELAGYLQERIKPNLNRGTIPLLARSIAKEIAHRQPPPGASDGDQADDDPSAEADDEQSTDDVDDDPSAEADDEQSSDDADEEQSDDDDADDEPSGEADDEESAESEPPIDFEADMRELQAELGEDWILRFSVQGDDGWLTAEKDDGSQRVEAPTADVLVEVVGRLNDGGGRST